MARQQGRFVDLCPNAGKCDFSPDQKIGGEILNIDTAAIENSMATVDLAEQDKVAQAARYDQLQ